MVPNLTSKNLGKLHIRPHSPGHQKTRLLENKKKCPSLPHAIPHKYTLNIKYLKK
jgi:hypothetical protein